MSTDYDTLTTKQLRHRLRRRELHTSGIKRDLIARLALDDARLQAHRDEEAERELLHSAEYQAEQVRLGQLNYEQQLLDQEHQWTPGHVAMATDDEGTMEMGSESPENELTSAEQQLLMAAAASGALDEPPVRDTATVIVVGSYLWTLENTVRDVLVKWWVAAGQPPVQLVTSGCPQGAEAIAREVATSHGWATVTVRDEDQPKLEAIVFGFVEDNSEGATILLDDLVRDHWVHIVRSDTSRVLSKWGSR